MSASCRQFRANLADVLSGAPRLAELAWHEHLLGCAGCRALLEAEEALETLLATLPEPQLPPALAGRVLARLSASRDDPLDALLELNEASDAPPDLAGDVLAGLRPHRARARAAREEPALDRLLERVPAPAVPAGLSQRVLLGLESHRHRARPRLVTGPLLRVVGALAAAVVIAIAYGLWGAGTPDVVQGPPLETAGTDDPRPQPEEVVLPEPEPEPRAELVENTAPSRPRTPQAPGDGPDWPPDELLASLELLESWDLLNTDDLDLALASLDEVDEVLLDMEGI